LFVTEPEPVVAIGLLTARDLDLLGSGFRRAFPIDDESCFDELLRAIDAAEDARIRNLEERH
jgi:hypothetical protein